VATIFTLNEIEIQNIRRYMSRDSSLATQTNKKQFISRKKKNAESEVDTVYTSVLATVNDLITISALHQR
jgi:hypothetical protein